MGCSLDSITEVAGRKTLNRLTSISSYSSHPLHRLAEVLGSFFSTRMRHPQHRKEL